MSAEAVAWLPGKRDLARQVREELGGHRVVEGPHWIQIRNCLQIRRRVMFHNDDKLDVKWLSGVAPFESFSAEDLLAVSSLGHRREFEAGQVLIDQGRYGKECYVLVTGSAIVRQAGEYVTSVGAGSMVGEMALIEHRPRNASVVAETDIVAVSFGIKEFSNVLEHSPTARAKVLELLNRRIQENENR